MASSTLFIFLSLLHFTLSAPYGSTQSTGRLIGNSFGVPFQNLTYDYIVGTLSLTIYCVTILTLHWIVRGGTGGLTIAERLSENPSISVAVIEAGGFYETDNGNVSQVPGYDVAYAYPSGGTTPLVDWGFTTEPQKV